MRLSWIASCLLVAAAALLLDGVGAVAANDWSFETTNSLSVTNHPGFSGGYEVVETNDLPMYDYWTSPPPSNITASYLVYYTTNVGIEFSARDVSVDEVMAVLVGDVLTNVVKRLVADGSVCAVYGHKWVMGCGTSGCLVLHPTPSRYCQVCGKTQTQEVSDWK